MSGTRARVWQALEFGATLATIAAAFVVLGLALSTYWRASPVTAPEPMGGLRSITGTEVSVGRLIKTNPAAKVVIVEFSDFQCRYCRMYSKELFPAVWRELVDAGKADYAFRHFPLDVIHPHALFAGDVAECAGDQGRFWEMHDALFSPTWSRDAVSRDAGRLGLDLPALERCLASDVRARVMADLNEGKLLGIAGTPTFLVGLKQSNNRMKVVEVMEGAQGVSAFTAAVEKALAQAKAAGVSL